VQREALGAWIHRHAVDACAPASSARHAAYARARRLWRVRRWLWAGVQATGIAAAGAAAALPARTLPRAVLCTATGIACIPTRYDPAALRTETLRLRGTRYWSHGKTCWQVRHALLAYPVHSCCRVAYPCGAVRGAMFDAAIESPAHVGRRCVPRTMHGACIISSCSHS